LKNYIIAASRFVVGIITHRRIVNTSKCPIASAVLVQVIDQYHERELRATLADQIQNHRQEIQNLGRNFLENEKGREGERRE
jgi:hypothetical protein